MRKETASYLVVLAVIIIGGAYFIIYLSSQPGRYDNLAKCLTESGVIMYGQAGCHACASQMQLLGNSFSYINEIDCARQRQVCLSQSISATPTWLINGTFIAGVLKPEQLANMTGCGI